MENFPESKPGHEPGIFEGFDEDLREHQKQIRQARISIFVVAAIQFVFGIISGLQMGNNSGWIIFSIASSISGIFLLLGIWAIKKPFHAILIALIFYSSLLIIDLIVTPSNILKGMILKLFIIAYLCRGIMGAGKAERWTRALRK